MTSTRAEIEKHTTASFSLTYEIGSPLFYVIVVGAGSILLIAYLAILAWILTLVYLRCCRHTSHRQTREIEKDTTKSKAMGCMHPRPDTGEPADLITATTGEGKDNGHSHEDIRLQGIVEDDSCHFERNPAYRHVRLAVIHQYPLEGTEIPKCTEIGEPEGKQQDAVESIVTAQSV